MTKKDKALTAGAMPLNGKHCEHCERELYKGEYVIQVGLIRRKYYDNECWIKHKQEGGTK